MDNSMRIDSKRMGEIALLVLKYRISMETKLSDLVRPFSKGDAGRIAKVIGIKPSELIVFMQMFKKDLLAEISARLETDPEDTGA